MKQIFDWMREQMKENSAMRVNSKKFYDNPQDGQYVDEVVLVENMDSIINEAEAKWEADCCEWKRKKNTSFAEAVHRVPCHIYTVIHWKFCPYCGKPIKISEVE